MHNRCVQCRHIVSSDHLIQFPDHTIIAFSNVPKNGHKNGATQADVKTLRPLKPEYNAGRKKPDKGEKQVKTLAPSKVTTPKATTQKVPTSKAATPKVSTPTMSPKP